MPGQIVKDDGDIQYVMVTKETLEGGLEVMRKSFFIDEKVSIAVELPAHPNAMKELEELCLRAARDGVSLAAVDKTTGLVVGIVFNKLQVKEDPGNECFFERYAAGCKEPSSKALVKFMKESEEIFDFFEHCQVDCLLELMFLASLPEYRGRGIGVKLCEASIILGRKLLSGQNVKQTITDESLPLEPVPKVVSAIFTSNISQKIGKKLGFEKGIEASYKKWTFNGKSFADRIGPETPFATLEYIRL